MEWDFCLNDHCVEGPWKDRQSSGRVFCTYWHAHLTAMWRQMCVSLSLDQVSCSWKQSVPQSHFAGPAAWRGATLILCFGTASVQIGEAARMFATTKELCPANYASHPHQSTSAPIGSKRSGRIARHVMLAPIFCNTSRLSRAAGA